MRRIWAILRDTAEGFVADEALTRAASIAYFALFSLGPLLFIASGVAGLVFGPDRVNAALAAELRTMLGADAAGAVQEMVRGALGEAQGGWALAIGIATLLLTASSTFGALQGALNAVWKTATPEAETTVETISAFVRAKAAAMGLVAATGFLLLVSLAASAALQAFGSWIAGLMPGAALLLAALNLALGLGVVALLFGAIYKMLPDRSLRWRDVLVGALVTAVLFSLGRYAIAFYIGATGAASAFGAAGTLAVVLLWLYYSAVIFLLGAEFTRAWSGKEEARPEAARARQEDAGEPVTAAAMPLTRPVRAAPPPPAAPRPIQTLAGATALLALLALLRPARRRALRT